MRPLSINRQSSTRPITSPKNGLSRWSRQRRTTLTAPDTINGPGALILVASCGPILSSVGLSVSVVGVDFPDHEMVAGQSLRDFASVRISAAASAASPMRLTFLAPRGVSGRDGAEPGREPEHGRQVPASAGGRRAKRRSTSGSPRPCHIVPRLHEGGPMQRSAARLRASRSRAQCRSPLCGQRSKLRPG